MLGNFGGRHLILPIAFGRSNSKNSGWAPLLPKVTNNQKCEQCVSKENFSLDDDNFLPFGEAVFSPTHLAR